MSAMECLGRTFNVVPIAAGVGLKLAGGTGYTFVTTGADTFTLTFASTFSGSYATGGTLTCNVYKNAASNGTAAWVLDNTLISTNTIVTTVTTAFYVSDVFVPDGKVYVKCTASAGGLVTAIQGDLTVKRTPPNLVILSA